MSTLPEGTTEPRCATCGLPEGDDVHVLCPIAVFTALPCDAVPEHANDHAFVQPSAPNSEPTPERCAYVSTRGRLCPMMKGEHNAARWHDGYPAHSYLGAAVAPSPLPTPWPTDPAAQEQAAGRQLCDYCGEWAEFKVCAKHAADEESGEQTPTHIHRCGTCAHEEVCAGDGVTCEAFYCGGDSERHEKAHREQTATETDDDDEYGDGDAGRVNRWLSERTCEGHGVVGFATTENGYVGVFIDTGAGEDERVLGAGDTAFEAVLNAIKRERKS